MCPGEVLLVETDKKNKWSDLILCASPVHTLTPRICTHPFHGFLWLSISMLVKENSTVKFNLASAKERVQKFTGSFRPSVCAKSLACIFSILKENKNHKNTVVFSNSSLSWLLREWPAQTVGETTFFKTQNWWHASSQQETKPKHTVSPSYRGKNVDRRECISLEPALPFCPNYSPGPPT